MGNEIIIVLIVFGAIFGVFYLYFSTRNKERLALIEKGADASIFVKGKQEKAPPFWKMIALNLGLLAIGIGAGVILGGLLNQIGVKEEIAFPGSIFLMAGAGLLTSFFVAKKMNKEE